MKQFLVLYLAPISEREEMMKNMSQTEMNTIIASWSRWKQENSASLIDGGNPVGKARSARPDGISDRKNEVDAYSIIQAKTQDDAMQLFGADHPHFSSQGARIEVMEIVSPPSS